MVITKKKTQVASFDPFLRDASGNPVGTRDPSPFFTGGGAVDAPVSGASTPEPIQKEPPLEGTFLTPTGTNRPFGLSQGGKTVFIGGSDLALFQQQQAQKNTLSGSSTQPIGSLADAAEARDRARQGFPTGREIPLGNVSQQSNISLAPGNLFQSQEASRVLEKLASGKELEPEEISMLGLNDLDIEMINQGKFKVSRLSQTLESINIGRKKLPFIGISIASLVSDTPSEKVDDLIKTIQSNVDLSNQYLVAAQANPFAKAQYLSLVEDINQKILELESRIKLLTIQSPELRANPDKVDIITNTISSAKTTLDGPNGILTKFQLF